MLNGRSNLCILNLVLRNVRQLHCSSVRGNVEVEPPPNTAAPNVADINITAESKFLIQRCFINGFYMSNQCQIRGPMILFPRSILMWNIANSMSINEASLSLFTVIEPKVELLIIGIEKQLKLPRMVDIKETMRKHNINVEILPVEAACTVYNIKCQEGAYIAAAMIPLTKRPVYTNPPLRPNV